MTMRLSDTAIAAQEIWSRFGPHLRVATPLGLGKPNFLLNAIYEHAARDSTTSLTLYTALSLRIPHSDSELGQRFLKPFADRHWGEKYPGLRYAEAAENGNLPRNIKVHEFYLRAGSALGSRSLQKDYQSINYTRVAEAVLQADVQVAIQLIARGSETSSRRYSLSCNPDVTLDLRDLYRDAQKKILMVGVVHPDLPFVGGEAEVEESFFDLVIDDPGARHELFALPRLPVSSADHAIGFYASQLVLDNGTLQIGIGSLSDAVVSALLLRHQNNELYQKLFHAFWEDRSKPPQLSFQIQSFSQGLYGLSEMVTDAYMHLQRAGLLKRFVTDEKSGKKTYLHGAFYLGSKEFYNWLRQLRDEHFSGLRMTRVSKVNDLYDPNEMLLRRQRINARFLNTCMQVNVLGGAASDTLPNGRVVSGVGGQYNFVAMSEELKDARSVLMLRSTREHNGQTFSNIVWEHPHLTIPRHLRDIVVTEYGIADLRNRSDEECVRALLEIADSRFQKNLMDLAKKNLKLSLDYEIPESARFNSPEKLKSLISFGKKNGAFSAFPLGSDFTPAEENIALALELLKVRTSAQSLRGKWVALGWIVGSFLQRVPTGKYSLELERLSLLKTSGLKNWFFRQMVLKALEETRS